MQKVSKVFYAGCFDPFTNGHLDVIRQALERFDEVVIGLGISEKKVRKFDRKKMVDAVNKVLCQENIQDKVLCVPYDHYTGETAIGLGCVSLIRGIKNKDEFGYELWLANYNRTHYKINTIFFLPSCPDMEIISSTYARELYEHGDFESLKKILPQDIFELICPGHS